MKVLLKSGARYSDLKNEIDSNREMLIEVYEFLFPAGTNIVKSLSVADAPYLLSIEYKLRSMIKPYYKNGGKE